MKLEEIKHIHFVGIKGVAISALAILACEAGIKVTGSDTEEAFFGDDLLTLYKMEIATGFEPSHITNPDLVICTAAHHGLDNVEAVAARAKNIPTLSYAQALRLFTQGRKVIAVCGTHGKTTTSAMLAYILAEAGLDPSYIIGVKSIPDLPANAHFGKGEYFVVEGDEYFSDLKYDRQPKFLNLDPFGVIITSIEHDHPDVYPDLKSIEKVFKKLIKRVPANGIIVADTDYQNVARLTKNAMSKVKCYGRKKLWPNLKLKIFGQHNELNATAAAQLAHELGVDYKLINKALTTFSGIGRRLQIIGQENDLVVVDDYAHHPTEIENAISALKNEYSDWPLWVVFEPHTFSRTEALKNQFAKSLKLADQIIITDIFASAREATGNITAQDLVDLAKEFNAQAKYVPFDQILSDLKQRVKLPAVVATIGAGDIYQLSQKILIALKHK